MSCECDRFSYSQTIINIILNLLTQQDTYFETYREFLIISLEIFRQQSLSHELEIVTIILTNFQFVDNTLLKLYVLAKNNRNKIIEFIKSGNHIYFMDVEQFLIEQKEFLLLGYKEFKTGNQRKAVETFKSLAFTNDIPSESYESCFEAIKCHICQINDDELFWDTLYWCFSKYGTKSVEILLNVRNISNTFISISEGKISKLLDKYSMAHAIYLKNLIEVENETL
ncbi:hypothetical protein HZS_1872 [Henneguya salminicola]|nr:hypothetical protein HZS_1872 [Henneguya salminicola]